MPLKHSSAVFYHYQLLTQGNQYLDISIHGESLFIYYLSWPFKNFVKINVWAEQKYVDELNKERENDFRQYKSFKMKVNNQWFYFLLPFFLEVHLQENTENNEKIKLTFVHDRVQKITRILTEESHVLTGPSKPNFSIQIIPRPAEENGPLIIIRNRKGRIFTIIKGLLHLAIYSSQGITNWMTTYKLKKEIKKEIKKEK